MQTIITQGFTLEQFIEAMRPVIRHELTQLQPVAGSQQPAPDEPLTVKEAAKLLNVCVATLHEWKRRGLLTYRKVGGRVYLNRAQVLAAGVQQQRTAKPSRAKAQPPT